MTLVKYCIIAASQWCVVGCWPSDEPITRFPQAPKHKNLDLYEEWLSNLDSQGLKIWFSQSCQRPTTMHSMAAGGSLRRPTLGWTVNSRTRRWSAWWWPHSDVPSTCCRWGAAAGLSSSDAGGDVGASWSWAHGFLSESAVGDRWQQRSNSSVAGTTRSSAVLTEASSLLRWQRIIIR